MDSDIKRTNEAVEEIADSEEKTTPTEPVAFVPNPTPEPLPIETPAVVESKPAKKHTAKKVILTALVIVLLVGSTAGAYFWRDKMANDLVNEKNASITALESEKEKLTEESAKKDANIVSLTTENSTLTDQQKQKDDYIAVLEDENASIADKAAAATLNDETWRDFVSNDYGFSIQFPGIPYKSDFSFNMGGQDSPMTYFGRSNSDGEYYEVEIANFSSDFVASLPAGDERLQMAMTSAVGYDDDISIEKAEFIDFHGHRALKETIVVSYGDYGTETKYGLVFFKENSLYVIDTMGTTEANFKKFIDSFSLK